MLWPNCEGAEWNLEKMDEQVTESLLNLGKPSSFCTCWQERGRGGLQHVEHVATCFSGYFELIPLSTECMLSMEDAEEDLFCSEGRTWTVNWLKPAKCHWNHVMHSYPAKCCHHALPLHTFAGQKWPEHIRTRSSLLGRREVTLCIASHSAVPVEG